MFSFVQFCVDVASVRSVIVVNGGRSVAQWARSIYSGRRRTDAASPWVGRWGDVDELTPNSAGTTRKWNTTSFTLVASRDASRPCARGVAASRLDTRGVAEGTQRALEVTRGRWSTASVAPRHVHKSVTSRN